MKKKKCTKCGRVLSLSEFHRNRTHKDGLQSRCKDCIRVLNNEHHEVLRKQNRCTSCGGVKESNYWLCKSCATRQNEAKKKSHRELKALVFDKYGGAVCLCCGEKHFEFLCIDHIEGGGNEHRKQVGRGTPFYRWLKKNDFPPGFRVLCYNCNVSRGYYGYCPHETEKDNSP